MHKLYSLIVSRGRLVKAVDSPIDFYYNILQVHLFFTITHTIADTASKVKTDQK
jgi:hypothetical protein